MSDYVYLKNLNGQQIKPVTDLAAINMTTTNGIGVSTVNGGTIGIIDGYIESAYYTEMADPAVGAANVSSAYVDGGTAVAILGAYTVASAVDTAAPSQQKVPSEKAVVDALNNVVVSGVSYYAGTGINIDQGHTVSVANVPQSSVAGLENTLTGINTAVAAKQDAISAGYRMSLDGTTLNQKRYFDIESPTSTTITLQAGHAYKITATNSSKTLDSEQIPANQFGLEGHAEIFVAGTGLIKTTSNVVLAQALEPDAVNNCTVRFHDGKAIISVEDHVAGYIVISASGTTAGTLPYALSTASNEYISFDASLNNITLDLGGAITTGEKHVVGNGYTETIVSGGINCTSKTTFSNLAANGAVVSSGTLTLGDVYIPSGSTVAVSGGGLAVEKVTGNGGVIDLGGTNVVTPYGSTASASGCTFTGGYAAGSGGAFDVEGGTLNLTSCVCSRNSTGNWAKDIYLAGASATFSGCTLGQIITNGGGQIVFTGENTVDEVWKRGVPTTKIFISGGAIINLNSRMEPGGGVTFAEGGATIYPSAGQASAYMLGGMTVPQIGNTNVVNLNNSNVTIASGASASASGCVFSGGSGGALAVVSGGKLTMNNVEVTGNTNALISSDYNASATLTSCYVHDNLGVFATGLYVVASCYAELNDCIFANNADPNATGAVMVRASSVLKISGSTVNDKINLYDSASVVNIAGNNTINTIVGSGSAVISSGASISLSTGIAPGGGIVIPSGADVNINDNDYNAFGGITASSVNSSGYIGGATVSVPDGATCTYTYWSGGVSDTTSATGPATVVVPGDMSYCGN